MRGCAYTSGNGFYLFAKANLSGHLLFCFVFDYRLGVRRYALEIGARSVSVEQEDWVG
jgi:hypothetical protein